MKNENIIRTVDPLGRVMLPKSLRESMNIDADDTVEVSLNGKCIHVRRFDPTCVICGETGAEYTFKNKGICANCLDDVRKNG